MKRMNGLKCMLFMYLFVACMSMDDIDMETELTDMVSHLDINHNMNDANMKPSIPNQSSNMNIENMYLDMRKQHTRKRKANKENAVTLRKKNYEALNPVKNKKFDENHLNPYKNHTTLENYIRNNRLQATASTFKPLKDFKSDNKDYEKFNVCSGNYKCEGDAFVLEYKDINGELRAAKGFCISTGWTQYGCFGFDVKMCGYDGMDLYGNYITQNDNPSGTNNWTNNEMNEIGTYSIVDSDRSWKIQILILWIADSIACHDGDHRLDLDDSKIYDIISPTLTHTANRTFKNYENENKNKNTSKETITRE